MTSALILCKGTVPGSRVSLWFCIPPVEFSLHAKAGLNRTYKYPVRTSPDCQSDLAPDALFHLGLAPETCFHSEKIASDGLICFISLSFPIVRSSVFRYYTSFIIDSAAWLPVISLVLFLFLSLTNCWFPLFFFSLESFRSLLTCEKQNVSCHRSSRCWLCI